MPEIVETLDISRSPQDVFSYVNDSSLFPRWQATSFRYAGSIRIRSRWARKPR
jgi:uncharacterized protein YndB with AHSA1/START domain